MLNQVNQYETNSQNRQLPPHPASWPGAPKRPRPPCKRNREAGRAGRGAVCLQQMYITARGWAPDAQVLQMSSLDLKDVKSVDGRRGLGCTFVTQPRHRTRPFTYSVVAVPTSASRRSLQRRREVWVPGRPDRSSSSGQDGRRGGLRHRHEEARTTPRRTPTCREAPAEWNKTQRNPACACSGANRWP